MFFIIVMILMVSGALMMLIYFISEKGLFSREFNSSFECGFDPTTSARLPFSLQFFLITVIFLIFDIEIVVLLPLPMGLYLNSPLFFMLTINMFLLVLLSGTFYEWREGALEWVE